jgi:hypothetical protein
MSPQPDTMTALVKAARDLDKNWCMFTGPPRSGPWRPGIRALDDKSNPEINAFQGKPKKRGKLTPEERKHHMDNNLCLYCGCCDSLLYKGSEDDDELGLEVTGWAWNKRTRTKTIMAVTRMRVKGSMVAVRLRLWGVDKRTV